MTDEVRFALTPTAQHWGWVLETWGARRWLMMRTMALCAAMLGLLLLANGGGVTAWILILCGPVLWLLPRVVIHRHVREMPSVAMLPREIRLTSDAVETTTEHSFTRYAGAVVTAQQVSAGGLLVFGGGQVLFFVPRAAVDAEQFELACRIVTGWVERNRTPAAQESPA